MKNELEELKAQLETALQEADSHKANSELYRKKAESLEVAVNSAKKTGKISAPVPGSFTAKWTDPLGGEQKKTVEFKDGRLRVILPKVAGLENLAGMYVASESLLLIAAGKEAIKAHLEQNPALRQLDEEKAAAVLTHFAGINAGFLK